MNVAEFAEQIVFGKSIAEKLVIPEGVDDFSSQCRLEVSQIVSPGREAAFKMHEGPGLSQPPKDQELSSERARGRLLHFLANHELLATELMALVLLKFPDAPHAFRRGVFVTLQEEQEHTRMYLKRMQECGVEFGSYPLSGHFWRVVEPMKDPIDFVARLSLTFEQANLDYSKHFAHVFRQLGDAATSGLLQQIYEDEIGHVRHGLQWFRQWKDPQQSDWDAYKQTLQFPMSPQRARGPRCAFNREGRLQAGLSEDFVDAVEVYRQSRGRPPHVFWFDPAAEATLSRELDVKERQLMNQLGRDLGCLMSWSAREDDVVLVHDLPSHHFKKAMLQAGLELPEFVCHRDRACLAARKLGGYVPWAWTPASVDLVGELEGSVSAIGTQWKDSHRVLFQKSWAAGQLSQWLGEESALWDTVTPDWFATEDTVGRLVKSIDDVKRFRTHLAKLGHASAIFKQDLGTAGRGQRRLVCGGELQSRDEAWLDSFFESGGVGVMEAELDRLVDLSFLWESTPSASDANFLGWTRQRTSRGRRYAGTYLRRPFALCPVELRKFLLGDGCQRLHTVRAWLEERLTKELSTRSFVGPWGVDVMLYRDLGGGLRVKPIVELNPRHTMGHVALRLGTYLDGAVEGEFRILTRDTWRSCFEDIGRHPLALGPDGRWRSGIVVLSEPTQDSILVPIVVVGRELTRRFQEWV